MYWIAALASLIAGACSPPHRTNVSAMADDLRPLQIAPSYDFRSIIPGGTVVSGKLLMTPQSGTYNMLWQRDQGGLRAGFGVEDRGLLASINAPFPEHYSENHGLGLAVYRIKGGHLDGYRIQESDSSRSRKQEVLDGPEGLSGRYQITHSELPFGAGHVMIRATGKTYLFSWFTPRPEYFGVGVRVGDVIVVGYSMAVIPGVTVHCRSGEELKGLGVTGARAALTVQTLTPESPANHVAPDAVDECIRILQAAGWP